MIIRMGRPAYEDFMLRADNMIEECTNVPPGTMILVELDGDWHAINDVHAEWDTPRPEWYKLRDEEVVPSLLICHLQRPKVCTAPAIEIKRVE